MAENGKGVGGIPALLLGPVGYEDEAALEFSRACRKIYESGQFVLGPYTAEMESKAREIFKGTAFAYSSATDATEAALRAVDCRHVIAPALSFPSSLVAAHKAGCRVSVVDVGLDMKLPLDEIKKKLMAAPPRENTVILASYVGGGMYSNMPDLLDMILTDWPQVLIVEDMSHAWGAKASDYHAGEFGDIVVASLFSTKPLHAATGALLTNRNLGPEVSSLLGMMREYGRDRRLGTSMLVVAGGSWRLSEMEAALFLTNLKYLDRDLEIRRSILKVYEENLPNVYRWPDGVVSNGYRAFFRTTDPAGWTKYLSAQGVNLVGKVYDMPVVGSPLMRQLLGKEIVYAGYPKAEKWCSTHICLPVYSRLDAGDLECIIDVIKAAPENLKNAQIC